jgi:predicted TPR repeat methyltransferase
LGPLPFTLITAIMALQFVADIETLFADLVGALEPGGHLIFAVHNPAFFLGDRLRLGDGIVVTGAA